MMKRRSIMLIGLVLIFLVIALLAAKFFGHSTDHTLARTNFTRNALTVVEKHSKLKLPDKSRGLNMVYEGSHGDPAFIAKIEIPADAEDNIKQQIEKRANEDYHPIGALSEKASWWNPAKLGVVVERKYTVDSSYVHVLLCHDNQQVVLFIESISF